VANLLQIREIERYHKHLGRLGRAGSIEETARVWVRRYARYWRAHYEQGRTAA
jgi:hypothetical protein